MENPVNGPGDYSLTPIRGPQPRGGQGGRRHKERSFDLVGPDSEQLQPMPRPTKPVESPLSVELSVGHPDQDEAGRRIDVTA